MAYRLQNDLWFCLTGDHLVFLDVCGDRYFRLPAAQERTFISYIHGGHVPDVVSLFGREFVSDGASAVRPEPAHAIQEPKRSALEQMSNASDIRLAASLEVAAAVFSMLLRLKTSPLNKVLASMSRVREKHTVTHASCDKQATQLIDAARTFSCARLFVPVAPSCLLDSLALAIFLARRHIHSTVVFGVTCTPFSAHSWVQVGDMVLNDTVGNANSYTPIGVF